MSENQRPLLLELKKVGKTFAEDIVALKDMDLRIHSGDFISLLGPSGCGKSTALRIIAGLTTPTLGQVDWKVNHGSGSIGVVFQEATLMPWATVEKNVWLPFRLQNKSFWETKDEIEHSLELVGLKEFIKSYPRELSGGMKMRVSIARALVTDPKVILMDEPFAALDEITRFKLNNDLLALRETIGCTIIFVTHSVFESVFLSDRIAVMAARPGRVIQELIVDEPYPRGETFRTSASYGIICKKTSDALKLSMEN